MSAPASTSGDVATFSVVIPSYNYAHTLRRTLESVANQTLLKTQPAAEAMEVVIIDDGSSDDTAAVAEKGFDDLLRPLGVRCVYVHQPNAGLAAARNTGLEHVRGDWVWFLDADDELTPNALETVLAAIERDTDPKSLVMVFGGYRSITPRPGGGGREPKVRVKTASPTSGEPNRDFADYLERRLDGLVPGTAVVRREVAQQVGFARECVRSQDIVFFGHVLARGRTISTTGEQGVVMIGHRHGDSLRRNPERMRQAEPFVVKSLFDASKLPAELMPLRRRFAGRYGVDVATNYYRAGWWRDSVRAYWQAVRTDPRQLLRPRPLSRLARAAVRAAVTPASSARPR